MSPEQRYEAPLKVHQSGKHAESKTNTMVGVASQQLAIFTLSKVDVYTFNYF